MNAMAPRGAGPRTAAWHGPAAAEETRSPDDAQVREREREGGREEFRCGALVTFVSALPLSPSMHYSRVRDERAATAAAAAAASQPPSRADGIRAKAMPPR